MIKIVNVVTEEIPKVKLIGKKYTDADRDEKGSFSDKWANWLENDTDKLYEQCTELNGVNKGYVGAMKFNNGQFEYWIGRLFDVNSATPSEMEDVIIDGGELGVCYLYGSQAEIYGEKPLNSCVQKLKNEGYTILKDGWIMERYDNDRFMNEDKDGNIILDYCFYLEK